MNTETHTPVEVDPIAAAWQAKSEQLAQWAWGKLKNRDDVWGGYLPVKFRKEKLRKDGTTYVSKSVTKPPKKKRGEWKLTPAVLKRHFSGRDEGDICGLHAAGPDNLSRFVITEVDLHGDTGSAEINSAAVRAWQAKLKGHGLDSLLVDSDGKGGFHLWVIFNQPIATELAYRLGKWIVADYQSLGLTEAPESNPKQTKLTGGKGSEYGNWMRLPGRHHTRKHWAKVWSGDKWLTGADAVEAILSTAGNDPAVIDSISDLPSIETDAVVDDSGAADSSGAKEKKKRERPSLLTPELAIKCLEHIPNADMPYDDWLSVGAALHHSTDGSDEAFNAFDEWSAKSGKYEAAKTLSTWDSFRRNGGKVATAGTLVKLARDNGFDPLPTIFDPKNPMPTARWFIEKRYTHPDHVSLLNDGQLFHAWNGRQYLEMPDPAIRSEWYSALEPVKKWQKVGDGFQLVDFAPNQTSVNHVVDATKAITFTGKVPPCWLIEDSGLPHPMHVLPATNGLVRLNPNGSAELFRSPTPLFYSPNALDYAFSPAPLMPSAWISLLDQIWPDDQESIEFLQEWFGYCLTPDTRQQKALLMVGPKRAGKGVIARTLSRVIGLNNVCGPTLAGLATNFGLWSLLGKLVAIVSDARLSGRTDQSIITERILAITGEDAVTVDRKNMKPVTVRIPARLMIATNELPRLADASGALASRFIVLMFTESFYGREDTGLEDKLALELPGILHWAIEGWRRLQRRGHFIQPTSSGEAIEELNDLASPVSAFVREWCVVQRGAHVRVADIFECWQLWCKEQGTDRTTTQQVFGRDLRAVVPGLGTYRPNDGEGARHREYSGIDITLTAQATLSVARNNKATFQSVPADFSKMAESAKNRGAYATV